MFRYTTPTHEFVMDINPIGWDSFIISYSQCGKIVLEKTENDPHVIEDKTEDPEYRGYCLSIKLTQEDTALFNPVDYVYVQIRCKYDTEDAFASDQIMIKAEDVIHKAII